MERLREHTSIGSSYDSESVDSVCLNCISNVDAIAKALFKNPANSCISVASEEDEANTKGIIYEALHRRKTDIDEEEKKVQQIFKDYPGFGPPSENMLKDAVLNNVILKDGIFIKNLQEKTHRTALFIFDIAPEEYDWSTQGFKETRRKEISPDRILWVIVPMRYREEILEKGPIYGIPLDKVKFVGDTEENVAFSYRSGKEKHSDDKMKAQHPHGEVKNLKVPDYESELKLIAKQMGGINTQPFFLHMTRLPE